MSIYLMKTMFHALKQIQLLLVFFEPTKQSNKAKACILFGLFTPSKVQWHISKQKTMQTSTYVTKMKYSSI